MVSSFLYTSKRIRRLTILPPTLLNNTLPTLSSEILNSTCFIEPSLSSEASRTGRVIVPSLLLLLVEEAMVRIELSGTTDKRENLIERET